MTRPVAGELASMDAPSSGHRHRYQQGFIECYFDGDMATLRRRWPAEKFISDHDFFSGPLAV
jgi:hypothetical protein